MRSDVPAPTTPVATALMERRGAVGWRDVALDGLNCYLRCIEAVLRGAGLSHDDVVNELGGAVTDDLGEDGRPYFRLRGGGSRWHIPPPGEDRWHVVTTRLAAGRPVLVWPDAYYWPTDRLRGRRHAHHHAVLAVGIEDGRLVYLDIDADEADGYAASVPVTGETARACTRVLEVGPVVRGAEPTRPDVRGMVAASVPSLGRFAGAAEALLDRWDAPTRRLAHAVDLWVLGDVQPQVYLLACLCQRVGFDDVAARGFETATLTKKISLLLFGLHHHKPVAPYDLCGDDIAALAARLRALERAAAEAAGRERSQPDRSAGAWLWRRLDTLSTWHFGIGLEQPARPP